MIDKKVILKVENTNELKKLLQQATDQLKQLELTLGQLESFKLKTKVN
ncbi:hypothetical protein [Bacillus sp. AK031]